MSVLFCGWVDSGIGVLFVCGLLARSVWCFGYCKGCSLQQESGLVFVCDVIPLSLSLFLFFLLPGLGFIPEKF